MAIDGPIGRQRRLAALALLGATLGLLGCRAPASTPLPAAFVIDPIGPAAAAEPLPAAVTPVVEAPQSRVRISGFATVPTGVKDLANVQEGRVSGSPVRIQDVATGRTLAQAVTYYDGSFQLDVAVPGTQRAVLVTLDLVDRADQTRTMPLEAPLMLRAGVTSAEVSLSPGTTVLAAFLARLAEVQAADVPDSIAARSELGSLIAAFEPETQTQFAMLAERSPELTGLQSLTGFEAGIRTFVGRLTASRKPATKAGVRAAYGL